MVSDNELENAITGSKFLLLGMSSSLEFAHVELRAARIAHHHKIPFGFYADAPFVPLRARSGVWLVEMAQHAKLLCGLLPSEIWGLYELFPKAHLVQTGNPMRDAMAFPKFTKAQVRRLLGVPDDELLIVAPGGKFMMGNAVVWLNLIEAVESLDREVCIAFFPHPGDVTMEAVSRATLRNLDLYKGVTLYAHCSTRFITKETMSTLDAIVGADVVVEFTGSASVAAAYQRIPVVNLLPELWMRHFKAECGDVGIETVLNGSAIAVETMDSNILSTMLWRVFQDPQTSEKLRMAQERAYPLPASRTSSLDALVQTIKMYCV